MKITSTNSLLRSRKRIIISLIIVAVVIMSFSSPYFFKIGNLLSLMQYSVVVGLLTFGQALVILGGGGGIDLSIGSIMSMCSVSFGLMATQGHMNIWVSVIFTLFMGLILGALNGLLITSLHLPPLIVTLGTMYLYASMAQVMSGGVDITGFNKAGFRYLGQSQLFGIPFQVLFVFIPVALFIAFVVNRTIYGRNIYAIGSGDLPAKFAGVPLQRTRTALYSISGLLAALGSIVTSSWLLTARSTAGSGYELQAVTIAVLGGIAITGGIGKFVDVILAVILIAILNNGLQLSGVDSTYQIGLLGFVLIASMLLRKKSTMPDEVA